MRAFWHGVVSVKDQFKRGFLGGGLEGRAVVERVDLPNDDSEGPQIRSERRFDALEYLWGDVVPRAEDFVVFAVKIWRLQGALLLEVLEAAGLALDDHQLLGLVDLRCRPEIG